MAATFTNSLRLEKQATGSNINTWGARANAAGGSDLADFAIAGMVTIPVAATNVVLTSANGAPDQSRAAILNVQGILSANVDIIAPNVTKTYVVRNGTSGSFTLGIRTAGGSGVQVVQGASSVVFCDGNDNFYLVGDANALIGPAITAHNNDLNAHYPASTTQRGFVELADNAETITGTDAARAVTPAGLSARTATDARTGLVELATNAECIAGTDSTRAVPPSGLAAALAAFGAITTGDFGAVASGNTGRFRIPGPTFDILVQYGETPTGSTTSGEFAGTITFPVPYQAAPAIFLTAARPSDGAVFAWVSASPAPSTTSFQYEIAERADGFDFSASAFWVAIGRADP